MTLGMSQSRDKCLLLVAVCIAAMMLAVATMPTNARANGYSARLPGKTWTTNGEVINLTVISGGVIEGPTALCVGPVQHSSGGYTFPYGWDCGQQQVVWEFASIEAAAGVDNPNSGSDYVSVFFA
jgi:hypothetical protein